MTILHQIFYKYPSDCANFSFCNYSEAVKKGIKSKKGEMVANQVKDQDSYSKLAKELYSKMCVTESINFVVEEASHKDTIKDSMDKFSCNIATILARDQEVVAV
jgi:hypothetical protein